MTGLASVVLLIAAAAIVWSSASREAPVTAAGASNSSVVANMTSADIAAATELIESEPLAELGAAPSAASTDSVNAVDVERALEVYDDAVEPGRPPAR